jgi:hypothetical protein
MALTITAVRLTALMIRVRSAAISMVRHGCSRKCRRKCCNGLAHCPRDHVSCRAYGWIDLTTCLCTAKITTKRKGIFHMEPIYSNEEIQCLARVFVAAKALLLSSGCYTASKCPCSTITTEEALDLLHELDVTVANAPSNLFNSL